MQLNGAIVPGNKLACVIIASAFENRWFSGDYDPNKIVPPDCFALSETGDDMMPSEESKDKQSTTCESCELMKWGSAGQGRKGKACKEVRRLALLPASALMADGNVSGAEMALLSVPTTSTKNWSNYVNELATEKGLPPWATLTEVSVAPDPKTQFKISFSYKGNVNEQYLGAMMEKAKTASGILMQPYEYTEQTAAAPAPEKKNRKY